MALQRHFEKHKGFSLHNDNKPDVTHPFPKKTRTSILLFWDIPAIYNENNIENASSRLDYKTKVSRPW